MSPPHPVDVTNVGQWSLPTVKGGATANNKKKRTENPFHRSDGGGGGYNFPHSIGIVLL